jgi:hypothetical protein
MSSPIAWDKCGAPLVPLGQDRFIHALPVTVYQFERFIWSVGDAGFDWESILPATRAALSSPNDEGIESLWLRRVTPNQADRIAQWLGGRLPTRREWLAAAESWEVSSVFGTALVSSSATDPRVARLTESLSARRLTRRSDLIPRNLCEYATQYQEEPRGQAYLLSTTAEDGMVTSGHYDTFRSDDVGFCCVFERDCKVLVR